MVILTQFARTLRFIGAYAAANIQVAMEYRISFWVQVFTMLIMFVAMGIFQLGLRRYESGNLLGMQG